MLDFLVGLGAANTGVSLVKSVRDLLKREKPDLPAIASHLETIQDSLYQAKESLSDAQQENRELRNQLEDQKKFLDISADMEYVEDGGFYIRKSERAAGKNIAYCPLCFKAAHNDVPLNPVSGKGTYQCPIHKSQHETQAWRDYQREQTEKLNRRPRGGGSWMSG